MEAAAGAGAAPDRDPHEGAASEQPAPAPAPASAPPSQPPGATGAPGAPRLGAGAAAPDTGPADAAAAPARDDAPAGSGDDAGAAAVARPAAHTDGGAAPGRSEEAEAGQAGLLDSSHLRPVSAPESLATEWFDPGTPPQSPTARDECAARASLVACF